MSFGKIGDILSRYGAGQMSRKDAEQSLKEAQGGNDRCCSSGYSWVMAEEHPYYRIDKCEGGAHLRFILKNPPIQKEKKVGLVKDLNGQLVEGSPKSVEDNILE